MAHTIGKLTALKVNRLSQPGMYADGGSLYLQVTSTAAKSWIFRYSRSGRSREMGLGSLSKVPLAHHARRRRNAESFSAAALILLRNKMRNANALRWKLQRRSPFWKLPNATLRRIRANGVTRSPRAMARDHRDICRTGVWQAACAGRRYRPRNECAGADLDNEARNGKPPTWAD